MENRNKFEAPGREEIDVNNKDQVEYWTVRFNISKVQLKAAVNAVGSGPDIVEAYLKKKYRSTKI